MKQPGIRTRFNQASELFSRATPRKNGSLLIKTSSVRDINSPSSNVGSDKPILPPGMTWGVNDSIEVSQRKNSISSEEDPNPVRNRLVSTASDASDPGNLSSNSIPHVVSTANDPVFPKKTKQTFTPLLSRMTGGKRKTRNQRKQRSYKNSKSRKHRKH